MKKIKVMSVFGTRPEGIKMAPIIKELELRQDNFESVVVLTGQHREMLQQVMDIFDIHEDYNLNIMKPGQTLNGIMAAIFEKLPSIVQKEKPDILLVHGDTTTTLGATIVAFNEKVKIGHVEAGLRTWNLNSPFPEEANRQVTDQLANFYFAPTELSKQNLLENRMIDSEQIIVTGNTSIDALNYTAQINVELPYELKNESSKLIVLTMHRRENWGQPMEDVFKAVLRLLVVHPDIEFVFPVHLNPLVQNLAHKYFDNQSRVHLISPLEPVEFHSLLAKAYLVMTDSGGVQEEAPSLDKPVFVLRSQTERPEGVAAGTLKLVGTDTENIVNEINNLLHNQDVYDAMSNAVNPYGDGHAAEHILDFITAHF